MPQIILTDELLCKLAEQKELRGITPKAVGGRLVWRARLFFHAAVVPAGDYDTPLQAINAVRRLANDKYDLGLSDAQLFWKTGEPRIRGVSATKNGQWEAFVADQWQRFSVGVFPDIVDALRARIDAEDSGVAEVRRLRFEKEVERRVQERLSKHLKTAETKKAVRKRRRRSKTNTSGVTGVAWHKPSGLWQAYINVSGRRNYIGTFKTFDEAVSARLRAEQSVHINPT